MPYRTRGIHVFLIVVLLCAFATAPGQSADPPPPAPQDAQAVHLTVVDENGVVVSHAQVTVSEPGHSPIHRTTDYAGRCSWEVLKSTTPYTIQVAKPNYYETSDTGVDPRTRELRLTITHEQVLQQQVNVTASTPGIDTQQVSDKFAMNTPEIVNVPYPTNIDIRNLLPFTPGVLPDPSGQVHVDGSETYMTLDLLDGFDMRSPVYGTLDMRVSTDGVRSLDTETTRYPVEYGRATGGIIAYTTGMGDNKFRYNATDFIPSFRDLNGIRFDTLEPRMTFSGPLRRNRAWFFNSGEVEFNNIYIPELPPNANTNTPLRGSDLLKFQANLGSANSLTTALLWNDYHSPYDGISAILPQQSTDKHDILAWLPYIRDQQRFGNGVMLDTGFDVLRYREGFEPHGNTPYELTPELPSGSDFENRTVRSQRVEEYANLYFPPRHWLGEHNLRAGIDLDHVGFNANVAYGAIDYLRQNRTLERHSSFPFFPPFSRQNLATAGYIEDRWTPRSGILINPGFRFDWDQIIRRPLYSPRIALNYSPPGAQTTTKITGGIGVYYEHTQLEYLIRALAGTRYDTYYAADGTTPLGPPLTTTFIASDGGLREARAINWSLGVQQKLPGQIYLAVNFLRKRISDEFTYSSQSGPTAVSGIYLLNNSRRDRFSSFEIDGRRNFSGNYAIFVSYTRSSATTNAALNFVPTVSILGPQQSGPLPWDAPNRIISWGWLPTWMPKFPSIHKNWDFVYTLLWNTGFPFDSINANEQIVGAAGSHRFPDFLSFSPGLEWRFHFRGKYFGLRGVAENITDRQDPYVVFNNVDSPQYLTFSQPLGRSFVTRIRLIH